jgi:hypothetical protein
MKVLYFYAAAGHPGVTLPLMSQSHQLLRPFQRFLGQAIHTAKQRQFRYQLPWERIRNIAVLSLTAKDTSLRITRPPAGWHLTDWPADRAFDLSQPIMVVNRGVTVRVSSAKRTAAGLRIETAEPLGADDVVFWCGRPCAHAPEESAVAPTALRTLDGDELAVRGAIASDGDTHWRCVVEGVVAARELSADGRTVDVEVLAPLEGVRRLVDAAGRSLELSEGLLKVDELPADGPLRADNGVRFEWRSQGRNARQGQWVQLIAPNDAIDAETLVDPRAAFCDGDVKEVWTQARHNPNTTIRVKDVDRDSYQLLLDRLPNEGELLYLPLDLRNLYLQLRALRQLAYAPLPHHAPLLRLCEDPSKVRWPNVSPRAPQQWFSLRDDTRSGTDEQRRFVAKALSSPDFAFLEGPPGSGKTTAICELIQQLVLEGQRVLLCASTHVAIDNVLERLLAPESMGPAIDAVRVGKLDRVDEKVQACQIDEKVSALVATWRSTAAFVGMGDGDLREMAERTVVMAANLTCGTTMGIVNHPLFSDRERDAPLATMPHWDVLIVDEASKTLTQEFMVPALLARRHVIVGDVQQLPPFTERADIVANLQSLVDEDDRELFPLEHQRAILLFFRLFRPDICNVGLRWLVVESPSVLDWMQREVAVRGEPPLAMVRVVTRRGHTDQHISEVTVDEVCTGSIEALRLAAADLVMVASDVLPRVAPYLPSDLVPARDLTGIGIGLPESNPWLLRHAHWASSRRPLAETYRERNDTIGSAQQAELHEQKWLKEESLPDQLAWRVTRLHELRRSREPKKREELVQDLERLKPVAVEITASIEEIQDIGLPSVLEVLQEGIGAERAKRKGALTEGIRKRQRHAFEARFERLSFQHRMHPDISAFPRETFYGAGGALRDANTIAQRDARMGWDYAPFTSRRVWLDVEGREQQNVNADEVRAMRAVLEDFARWAKRKGPPPGRPSRTWEVACLSFYVKQERAISQMLRELTGEERATRFKLDGIEVVCGTVDRFQGREADLVLLSMRNTSRVGFLDSPNRLNVAVTRARQQLVVIGKREYFRTCRISELKELVGMSAHEPAKNWLGGRR